MRHVPTPEDDLINFYEHGGPHKQGTSIQGKWVEIRYYFRMDLWVCYFFLFVVPGCVNANFVDNV